MSDVPTILRQGRFVPLLYLAPALVMISIFIVYPTAQTVALSLRDKDSAGSASNACVVGKPCWGILENYRYVFTSELDTSSPQALWRSFYTSSFGNTIKWIVLMVGGSVGIGLLMAVLTDYVRYEVAAKSILFLPMAISFVGAGVIWKFVYEYGTDNVQIGLLNTLIRRLGGRPIAFLQDESIGTYALIFVGIWGWTGFCTTIISTAIKAIPTEITEAARVDGASPWIIFRRITLPLILPTVLVVIATMTVIVLKIFDIVFVMTGGHFHTDVLATRMYRETYFNQQTGRGAALAVILILLTLPIMYFNIVRFRDEERLRS